VRDDCDRRKIRIHLTPQARRLREPLLGHVRDVNLIATEGVPRKDLETTRRVLLQLMANLNAAGANQLMVDEEQA
jgi:DNA-binding MarR family transcriptional regulator